MKNFTSLLLLLCVVSLGQAVQVIQSSDGQYLYTYYSDGGDLVKFTEADFKCATYNKGHGVYIKSSAMQEECFELVDQWGGRQIWLGMWDYYTENYWYYLDGTKVDDYYTNWNSGEPNDKLQEDCGTMYSSSGKWNDEDCGNKYGFICQKDANLFRVSDNTQLIFSDARATSAIAEQKCAELGYQLVRLTSDALYEMLDENEKRNKATKYWIGGAREWTSGRVGPNGNTCASMGSRDLEAEDCNQELFYICEGVHSYGVKISTDQNDYMESDEIIIDCTASGIPLPNVTWHKGHQPVDETSDREVYQTSVKGKSTLIIKSAKLSDTDRYRCFAENDVDGSVLKTKRKIDIRVHPAILTKRIDSLPSKKRSSLHAQTRSEDNIGGFPANCPESQSNPHWMLPAIFGLSITIVLFIFVLIFLSGQRRQK
uniref:uncharacterized protein LOC120326750 n=1 Tax=Styela clava TaxID=7725 RepID=UPI00193992A5|nr:uncharacterized protein LOC120326750 [Styela clava]